MFKFIWFRVICIVLFVLTISQAQFYNNYQHVIGERAAGLSGAYTALADNSTSLWYNPAGLSQIKQPNLNVSGNTYSFLTTSFDKFLEFENENGGVDELSLSTTDFSVIASSLVYGKSLWN